MSVLIVEDNPTTAHVIRNVLERLGQETVVATNGRQGLEALDADPLIDLVISDLAMPEMDGLELVAKIRENPALRGLPVLIASATADADHVKRAALLGISDFIVKPVNVDRVARKVTEVLRQRRPVLADRATVMGRLGISGATYAELLGGFAAAVQEKIVALEGAVSGEPDDAALAALAAAAAELGESAAVLGAEPIAASVACLREQASGVEMTGRCHALLRQLRRLLAELPADVDVALGHAAAPAVEAEPAEAAPEDAGSDETGDSTAQDATAGR